MKTLPKIATLLLSISLINTGCSNLTPGENAAITGAATGLAVGLPLALSGVNPAVTIPVTAGAAVLAGGGTYLITKHQASQRQIQTAESRARNYVFNTHTKTRYIAVRTENERPQSTTQVMIYDAYSQRIVNSTLYQLNSFPPIGSKANFGGYDALYIGTGL